MARQTLSLDVRNGATDNELEEEIKALISHVKSQEKKERTKLTEKARTNG